MDKWVEILYFDGVGLQVVYGKIRGTVEECILNEKENAWIRLDKVSRLDESGTALERFEDDLVGTEGYFYLRAGTIVRVAPIRADVTFWEEGKPPLDHIIESQENN
jgi:hypothetical protein